MKTPGTRAADQAGTWSLGLLAALGIFLVAAGSMVREVTYDEEQYLAAGQFAQAAWPYRDFVYLQPPLYPLLLGLLFRITDYHLLAARALTALLAIAAGGFLWASLRRLGAGRWLAAVLMLACYASPFLTSTIANTRNDALPLALMLAGLHAGLRGWLFAAATLLGLAVQAKLTYLFGPAVLAVFALQAPRTRLLPIAAGLLLAALPALPFLLAAPDAFRFGLLDYHLVAPVDWYTRQGMADLLQPATRLSALAGWAVLGGNLTLLALAAGMAAASPRGWHGAGLYLLALLAGAMLLGFVPSPAWAMYYAPAAPLLACWIAHAAPPIATPRARLLVGIAATASLPVIAVLAPDLQHLAHRAGWVGLAAHDTAIAIRQHTGGGTVATLFPHLVMDANPIRPDLAAGPFVFRSAASLEAAMGADRLARLHALGPDSLASAFATPPAAILTGPFATAWSTPMDAPLAAWAQAEGWRPIPLAVPPDMGTATLWLPPPLNSPPHPR